MKDASNYPAAAISPAQLGTSAKGVIADSSTRKKLELIQACRGIAALLVVLFHVTEFSQEKLNQNFLSGLFAFGGSGVDFFFVLSGFIIFFAHQADIGQKQKLNAFIVKRVIRVYPLYWIITLALLPIYFLIPSFGKGYERDLGVILKSLLLVPQENFPVLIVGWTLSHEIFFYFIFGLAIWLTPKVSRFVLCSWLGGTLTFFWLSVSDRASAVQPPLLLNFIFNPHNLEFAFGCLAAYWVVGKRIKLGVIYLISGVVLFITSGLGDNYTNVEIPDVIAYGLPSMLVVLGAASIDLNQGWKSPTWLNELGDASYSIYLVHYPCLAACFKVAIALNLVSLFGNFLTMSLLTVIAVIVGWLTYLYLEKPLITWLRRKLVPKQSAWVNAQ
ncbi:acyltransferase [Trichocoleus sp. FACHB-591]|uniref:acyltransferase family protein n=1 Tax=Trichocoleus sp. FACHB-591 TaxID=2692872 RepID=UPI001683FE57|nr:acyltransferase [Trichocoleus sp. FACHB-591]MBD2095425.1 acyltransferase [Trichocoleus sp. FACHB-591]